ncbi:T9SS type A sorting domain-containing protein [Aquimarina sp. 2201CG5-10]|uniref:T9SS type A sorting domain-containing protein n=1 Tax=Aquimarina callyspongiae TaxID=3098150 RepID=UPI002AB36E64|nr:T9SS type A sorting domain-containing protein [Aquimarina sp. 2201CG5-10]MDY8138105.1 T9SS type A sorting domain-containing protein [Aquimarina sp. 2201CG5-10]
MKLIKRIGLKSFFLLLCIFYTTTSNGQMPNEIEINNGIIKLKLDLTSGGAISYLSDANNNYNVVNIHDKGRYIQQSYYNGQHLDRRAEGQHPNFSPWNWNPIQAGDIYGNRSQVITYRRNANELYVKNRPMLWDMNNSPCECYFETWVTFSGTAAHVKNKLTVFRTDNLWQTRPYHQELPALYTVGDLYKLYTYRGSAPWTNDGLSRINNSGPPWAYWNTNESWAALVNNNNWGVGIYNPISTYFVGGFSGSPGGGPYDNPTGYFSPLITKALSKNGTFQYEYDLILGNLNDIRTYVYQKRGVNPGGNTLSWEFNQSGNNEGWIRSGGTNSIATTGGSLNVGITSGDPQIINQNVSFNPNSFDYLKIGIRNFTNNGDMDFFWSNSSGGFSASKRIRVSVAPNNNNLNEYVFDLRNVSLWNNGGTINAIRIDPPGDGNPSGENVKIDYIRFTGNTRSKEVSVLKIDETDNILKVFPNPFAEELNIHTKEKSFILYNLRGKKIITPHTKTKNGFNIITNNLTSGLYYIKVGKEVFKIYKSKNR